MHIKTKKIFKELVTDLTNEVIKEITTSADAGEYLTPNFLQGKKGKKKKKKISTNGTGFKMVEGVDDKDIKMITKLIRNVVGDILRDIWLKRTAWK